MGFMESVADPLIRQGLIERNTIHGCTPDEVSTLMAAQGVSRLPNSYVEFLTYGGKNPYWLSHTGEWDYAWLLEGGQTAAEIAIEYNWSPEEFEGSFVFQTHQGYRFYYFSGSDLLELDPKFWIFNGGDPVSRSRETFSEFITSLGNYLPEAIALRRRLGIN